MKGAVKDDPVQFLLDGTPEFLCIIPDPVDTDVYFPTDGLARIGQREGDDIRIKVMLKELPVDFQQALVGTEDIVQFSQVFLFLSEERDKKLFKPGSFLQ
jgi:hypothetical protein